MRPLLIVTGALDGYDDDPEAGAGPGRLPRPRRPRQGPRRGDGRRPPRLRHAGRSRARFRTLPANRGKGGLLTMAYNPQAAARSHALAVAFFSEAMGG